MMRLACLLALAACGSSDTEPACIADQVGALRPKWQQRPGCDDDQPWCETACRAGDGDACFHLAITLEAAKHDDEAFGLFEHACRLGQALGCTNYAAAAWSGKVDVSKRCIRRIFERTCEANEVFGCGMVGRMVMEGAKTPERIMVGANKLLHACDRFGGPPCRFLALYIEQGLLGPPDRGVILGLMARACEGHDEDACGNHATVGETFHSSED